NRIKSVLPSILLKKKLDMVFVMLTDIMLESTTLVYCGESAEELVKDSFVWRGKMEDSVIVDKLVSRKKQFIPALMKTLTERLN
ncbi:MAG: inorganic diphosphatase, partial [Agathobacter sp.]|nr:inorganic diphosphatase [Agathobacter sp.]